MERILHQVPGTDTLSECSSKVILRISTTTTWTSCCRAVHHLLKGNGDSVPSHRLFPYTSNLHSYAIEDLNNDGFMDGGPARYRIHHPHYGRPDRLWLNDDNHWLNALAGVESNRDAVERGLRYHGLGHASAKCAPGESYASRTQRCAIRLRYTTVETWWYAGPAGNGHLHEH